MKKSVVILLAVVCLLSVLLISFLGRIIDPAVETVYVEGINIYGCDTIDGLTYKNIFYDENGYARYQIDCEVVPANASNNKILFSYDTTDPCVKVSENGLVEITTNADNPIETSTIVTLKPADGVIFEKPVRLQITAWPAYMAP